MSDAFEEKSKEWDVNPMIQQLSANVGKAMLSSTSWKGEMNIMDFGAGTGLIAGHVAPFVNSVTAVDVSVSMLEQLSKKTELVGKVHPVCQNILDTPLEQTFDAIVSAMALHHVEDTAFCCVRFAEHLNAGGVLALADLDTEDGTFHPPDITGVFHHGFSREELSKHLRAAGFDHINFVTAHTVEKQEKQYPIFLVTAQKAVIH